MGHCKFLGRPRRGVAFFLLLVVGCGEVDRSPRYIPTPHAAEIAMRAAMEAWKRGEPVGPIAETKPVVYLVDSHRKPGQTLSRYEILGEVPGNAPRCFAVNAELIGPDKQERLRYVVVGIDPLWVFLQDDYDMLSHWEHVMEEKTDKKQKENPGK